MRSALLGAGPEHIEMAVRQSLQEGMTSRKRPEQAISSRSQSVRDLIGSVVAGADS